MHKDTNYFFVHIPKTAGTSFRFMLYDVFPADQVYPNEDELAGNNGLYEALETFRKMPPSIFHGKRVVVGHLPATAAQLLPTSSHLITFLRDPMSRVMSDINFKYPVTPFLQGVDINEAIHKMRNVLFNLQVRHFADLDAMDTPYFDDWRNMDDQGLKQAKKRLQACAFFGITEQFEASVQLAGKSLGWELGSTLHLNKTLPQIAKGLSAESIQFLRKNNSFEMEFYEFALQLFEKRKRGKRKFFFF